MYICILNIQVPIEVKNQRAINKEDFRNNEMDRCDIPEWEMELSVPDIVNIHVMLI